MPYRRPLRSKLRNRLYRFVRRLSHYPPLSLPEVVSLALLFIVFNLPKNPSSPPHNNATHLLLPRPDRSTLLAEERQLINRNTVNRTNVANDVVEYRLFLSPPSDSGKIVALVEARNVADSIVQFFRSLSTVVDSIIVLDDHSTDASRNVILGYNARYESKVEVLLQKTGEWAREELRDRQLLLEAARRIGGTHYVLLDYDEYLSANCVHNGYLRDRILQLLPGESLYLPWVEMWKAPNMQRVMLGDAKMNFLTRRQIVVFADDGQFNYTAESAVARVVGTDSIHALRCPRSICPKPKRYVKGEDMGFPEKVKRATGCYIVEMRFVNLNNVLVKSAWYEGLGRIIGAKDGVTTGKMVDLVLRRLDDGAKREKVEVDEVKREWVAGYEEGWKALGEVEMWRVKELLGWVERKGAGFFKDLKAMSMIDLGGLRVAIQNAEQDEKRLLHVPQKKKHGLLVVLEDEHRIVTRVLRHLGVVEVDGHRILGQFAKGVRLSHTGEDILQYEEWREAVEGVLDKALRGQDQKIALVSTVKMSNDLARAFVELLVNEFAHMHVTVIISNRVEKSLRNHGQLSTMVRKFAMRAGSHIRVMDIPSYMLSSYATLHWMRSRIFADPKQQFSKSDDLGLLALAEELYTTLKGEKRVVARLIFSLNMGRSGSKYLSELLESTNNAIVSVHEPRCEEGLCSGGGAVRMQNRTLKESYEWRRKTKLGMIREQVSGIFKRRSEGVRIQSGNCEYAEGVVEISGVSGCVEHIVEDGIYAETNPNFKAWFYDVVLDEMPKRGYDVSIVVLRKYMGGIVKSLYETGYFSNRDGYNWMETSAGVNSVVKVEELRDDSKLDAVEKLTSYVINADMLFVKIEEMYKTSATFVHARSERIFTKQGARALLKQLGLRAGQRTEDIVGVIRDKYREGGKKRALQMSLLQCERRIQAFLKQIERKWNQVGQVVNRLDKLADFAYRS